ncbi:MAG: sigma-E processing peptidase SpoIIGA [Clostridiales bacterium]|nr:sigma-E processing peptidase SpoIIGA [Clostridiales bacterium]
MEIYAEYLFIQNFAAGLLILLLTGKICGRSVKRLRLVLGSAACGLYAFVILVDMSSVTSVLGKLIFSSLLIVYTFAVLQNKQMSKIKQVKIGTKILITFYITSFFMGGATIAGMYLGGLRGMTANGAVYIASATYFNVISGILAAWLIGSVFAKYIKERTITEKMHRKVTIEIGGVQWTFDAMIDTGNFLKEPITGKPVAILCRSAAEEILKSGKVAYERFLAIPYQSVGQPDGVLTGFIADQVTIDETITKEMVLAVYEREFNQTKEGTVYRLLLNRAFMEGGIAVHV